MTACYQGACDVGPEEGELPGLVDLDGVGGEGEAQPAPSSQGNVHGWPGQVQLAKTLPSLYVCLLFCLGQYRAGLEVG